VVEVEQAQREAAGAALGALELEAQALVEHAPVREAGERVLAALALELQRLAAQVLEQALLVLVRALELERARGDALLEAQLVVVRAPRRRARPRARPRRSRRAAHQVQVGRRRSARSRSPAR
jgi:hypothetical protein